MIGALTNHLWQSTLFVLAAGLVAAALHRNGAHVRHRIWLIASLKFLVPFSVLLGLGSALPRWTPAAPAIATSAAPDLSITVDRISQPFTSDVFTSSPPATTEATTSWTAVVAAAWACGVAIVVLTRGRDWRRVRAAVRASSPAPLAAPVPVRSSPGLLEPGVVGLFRPVLLVPEGIEAHLSPAQLHAVLTHELCHVRRHDNLTSALHMVVETIFWFHPLVWWIGARLVDERERACDEHVLRVCGDPRTYAESILEVCKRYVESPLACVSGVTGPASPKPIFGGGGDLRQRVAAILVNRVGLRLSLARRTALVVLAMLAVALPLAIGTIVAPVRARAEAQRAKADRNFDVASVKPCGPDSPPRVSRAGGAGQASVGYLNLSCLTLEQFVYMAYAGADSPLLNRHGGEDFVPDAPRSVRGGPSWAHSDTYTIEAKADGVTDRNILTGPMLRAVLEDRFQLKTHRATEPQSMYTLTVAKSGLEITPLAPGECWEHEPGKPDPPHAENEGPCGSFGGNGWGSEQARGVWLGDPSRVREGQRMVDLLWRAMLRNVIDKTGLNGRYSFALDFTPDDTTPGVQGAKRPGLPLTERPPTFKSGDTIFQALEKLGLHLAQTKAPSEYIVIDRAERPGPNDPTDEAMPPARASAAFAKASASAPATADRSAGQGRSR